MLDRLEIVIGSSFIGFGVMWGEYGDYSFHPYPYILTFMLPGVSVSIGLGKCRG